MKKPFHVFVFERSRCSLYNWACNATCLLNYAKTKNTDFLIMLVILTEGTSSFVCLTPRAPSTSFVVMVFLKTCKQVYGRRQIFRQRYQVLYTSGKLHFYEQWLEESYVASYYTLLGRTGVTLQEGECTSWVQSHFSVIDTHCTMSFDRTRVSTGSGKACKYKHHSPLELYLIYMYHLLYASTKSKAAI